MLRLFILLWMVLGACCAFVCNLLGRHTLLASILGAGRQAGSLVAVGGASELLLQ